MFGENGISRKSIFVNLAVLAVVAVTSGFTLTACQPSNLGNKSTGQLKENSPPKPESKKSDEQLKENSSARSNQKTSNKQLKANQHTQSNQKTSDQNQGKEQDTEVDDDPE